VLEEELGAVASWHELCRRHAAYHRILVMAGDGLLPHTFMPGFVVRDLTGIDGEQLLARVESHARPLSAMGMNSAPLREVVDAGEHDRVGRFMRTWDESMAREFRPAFTTPRSSVTDDVMWAGTTGPSVCGTA
jgi:hypothetical protein